MTPYIGRYAPSPTGALHLGNARTAVLAWLHARLNNGRFLLRMEDLDQPRVVEGSAEQILDDLQWLGLDWDGEVLVQSERLERYQAEFQALLEAGYVYPCFCSRKDIRQAISAPHGSVAVYPGTCRDLTKEQINKRARDKEPAWRFRVPDQKIVFNDGALGKLSESLALECGDFIIKRADGQFAYQLAVVVDDIAQNISSIVRGADLQQSTARQILLYRTLGATEPEFWHVPLMLDDNHIRLSKRDGSDSIQQWRQSGKSAEQLIALLMQSVGLWPSEDEVTATQLLEQLSLSEFVAALRR